MKCPGDATHRGVTLIKLKGGQKQVSPHFAKATCTICGVWIEWLSESDYNYAKSLEPERMDEATDVQETDVERMGRCIGEAVKIKSSAFDRHCPDEILLQIAFKLYDGRE